MPVKCAGKSSTHCYKQNIAKVGCMWSQQCPQTNSHRSLPEKCDLSSETLISYCPQSPVMGLECVIMAQNKNSN